MITNRKRPTSILVAEDEVDAAQLLVFHLQRRGYVVRCAADGRTALNEMLESRPDLLILDLMLPELHGYEVCRLVKSAPSIQATPILMLTAMVDLEDKLRGFKLGADDYMTKPYAMKEFLARVDVLLRRGKTAPVFTCREDQEATAVR
ncbi:MAG: response regulator [Verrucomicrobiota bacterium]